MEYEPITTTWNELMFGSLRINGYVVYAVYDENMRCAYVGMSKNVNGRTCTHIYSNESDVAALVERIGNPVVHVYTLECADEFIQQSNGGVWNQKDAGEKSHAHAAEYEVCQILRPYLNRRLTYSQSIDWLKKFYFMYTNIGYQSDVFLDQCRRILNEWNLPQSRFDEEIAKCEQYYAKKLGLSQSTIEP